MSWKYVSGLLRELAELAGLLLLIFLITFGGWTVVPLIIDDVLGWNFPQARLISVAMSIGLTYWLLRHYFGDRKRR
jgi:hypothetical protein